jgi:predicted kinase
MSKILYILRSPSGGGKSTVAAKLASAENIFETDNYFMKNGKYVFNPAAIKAAHAWNKEQVENAMQEERTPIVVANTNIQKWEFAPYISLAKAHGYKIEFHYPESPWFLDVYPRLNDKTFTEDDVRVFFEKNTHGVPFETIRKMMTNWEVI